MLKEMQTHPVKPASQIFRVELEQDKATWQAILQEETSIDGFINKIINIISIPTEVVERTIGYRA